MIFGRRNKKPICVLVFSNEFRTILQSIKDNKIASYLLNAENSQQFKYDISFINITDKPSTISYISSTDNLYSTNKWTQFRKTMSVEDFIRKITEIYDHHILSNFRILYMNAYNDKKSLFKENKSYKIGDRIAFYTWEKIKKTGVIVNITTGYPKPYEIKVDTNNVCYIEESDIIEKLRKKEAKFKIGDKIILLGHYKNPPTGSKGNIIKISNDDIYVIEIKGKNYFIHENELELDEYKPKTNEEIINNLINETKSNKLIWDVKEMEISNSVRYSTERKLTKDKILTISVYAYKGRAPNIYIDMKKNSITTTVKNIHGHDKSYDLLGFLMIQTEKNKAKNESN